MTRVIWTGRVLPRNERYVEMVRGELRDHGVRVVTHRATQRDGGVRLVMEVSEEDEDTARRVLYGVSGVDEG